MENAAGELFVSNKISFVVGFVCARIIPEPARLQIIGETVNPPSSSLATANGSPEITTAPPFISDNDVASILNDTCTNLPERLYVPIDEFKLATSEPHLTIGAHSPL